MYGQHNCEFAITIYHDTHTLVEEGTKRKNVTAFLMLKDNPLQQTARWKEKNVNKSNIENSAALVSLA